ncbi:MAG: hypothetical protein K2G26_05180, partial [Clostridia bacterium]|nr:hypothetical protein [Clostridia bacterium]
MQAQKVDWNNKYPTFTATYTNDGATKDFYTYFGVYICGSHGSTTDYKHNGYATFSGAVNYVKSFGLNKPAVAEPNTLTYNGQNQNFTIDNFADTGVTLAKVKRTEIDGTETTVYDPSTSTGTNPVSGNTLTLKDAGTYTLTFKRPTGEDAADEWDGGDKSETCEVKVTINPLKIAVPTIGNATQTYNSGGCTFNVTGFDSDLMTAEVSDGALWNDATKQLKATNAGEYTVSFGLKNKNYVWSDIGTAEPQTANFEIEKKTLQLKWTTQQTSVEDGYFMLPSLDVTYEVQQLVGDVKYYNASDCTITGGAVTVSGSAVDISEIVKEQEYYAVVEISDDVKKNYNFNGAAYYHFDTSDGRTIVVVSVANSGTCAYDDTPHAAEINVVDQTGNSLTPGKDIFIRVIYKAEGDGEYDGEGSTNAPKYAGTYTVVVSIAPNSDVDFRLADSIGFEYVINKADPVLDPVVTNSTGLIAGGLLSEINIIKKASNAKATDGTYAWTAEKLISGNNNYDYTFTPDDTRNYNTATGSYPLSAHDAEITSISVTFNLPADEEGEPTVTVYDSWKLDDLRKYITVTGTLNNGETVDVYPEEYTLNTVSGRLTEGSCTVTVKYTDSITDTFAVNVTACVLAEISAEFYADRDIFTSTRLADLNNAEWLVVTGTNNDGTPYSGGISGYILSIDGDENAALEAGENTVTVTYWVTGIGEPFVTEFT